MWGRHDSGLHDYAGRHWAGLLSGVYGPRWAAWFDFLHERAGGEPRDGAETRLRGRVTAIEDAWVAGPPPLATEPAGDAVRVARTLLDTPREGSPVGTVPAGRKGNEN